MGPLTSVTMVEGKELLSYTQPSRQVSLSGSVMLVKVPFRWRSCHWRWIKRWHFSGLKSESSGMEILRRVSGLRMPVSLSETVSLSRMCTQQRWPGMAAVKFSNNIWHIIIIAKGKIKTIWRTWNFPRPPTWSRSSWKAIECEQVILKRMLYGEKFKGRKRFPFINSHKVSAGFLPIIPIREQQKRYPQSFWNQEMLIF